MPLRGRTKWAGAAGLLARLVCAELLELALREVTSQRPWPFVNCCVLAREFCPHGIYCDLVCTYRVSAHSPPLTAKSTRAAPVNTPLSANINITISAMDPFEEADRQLRL